MSSGPKKMFTAEILRQQRMGAKPGAPVVGASAETGSVTNDELLHAIQALQTELADRTHLPPDKSESQLLHETEEELEHKISEEAMLRTEIRALSRCIHETKAEIKALSHADEDKFSVVTNELDQIVSATEQATNTILESAEKVDELGDRLREHAADSFSLQVLDEMTENNMKIYEACNFQDLCGQRTTKVINSLKFIEERIEKMMEIWGEDSFDDVAPSRHASASLKDERPEGEQLHGPANEGGGISQADIDALFD